ncbi:MAG: SPOR domain-containing protein [Polaromonas sp.]
MPFFNFRRASSTSPNAAGAAQPESMEVIRKRAKHRLIGASVLVLAGVVGFPLLFDTQPRPIAVDIPIEIPGKNTVKPLVMPAKSEPAKEVAAPAPAPTQDKVAAASSLGAKEEIVSDKKPAPAAPVASAPKKEAEPVAKPEAKPAPKAEAKPEPKPEAKPAPKADDGARAKALLDGQTATTAASTERLVVQVGAFADTDKAQEVRLKLEKAGLKTYTQVAETKDGKRIRVRVGPFASKAEAEKAASKIKTLDLPASILTL